MPTYQYTCAKCNHSFEVFQSISDPPLRVCPRNQCARKRWGRGKVKRVLSGGAGFLFKGTGFYTTDYRSEGYRQAAKKESEAAAPKKGADAPAPKKGGAIQSQTDAKKSK